MCRKVFCKNEKAKSRLYPIARVKVPKVHSFALNIWYTLCIFIVEQRCIYTYNIFIHGYMYIEKTALGRE